MAVGRLRYAQLYEKYYKQTGSHEEANRRAIAESKEKPVEKKKQKEARLRRLLRLTKMAVLGKHYKEPKDEKFETVRTKAIAGRLKKAGLTEKEIARMRGKR